MQAINSLKARQLAVRARSKGKGHGDCACRRWLEENGRGSAERAVAQLTGGGGNGEQGGNWRGVQTVILGHGVTSLAAAAARGE